MLLLEVFFSLKLCLQHIKLNKHSEDKDVDFSIWIMSNNWSGCRLENSICGWFAAWLSGGLGILVVSSCLHPLHISMWHADLFFPGFNGMSGKFIIFFRSLSGVKCFLTSSRLKRVLISIIKMSRPVPESYNCTLLPSLKRFPMWAFPGCFGLGSVVWGRGCQLLLSLNYWIGIMITWIGYWSQFWTPSLCHRLFQCIRMGRVSFATPLILDWANGRIVVVTCSLISAWVVCLGLLDSRDPREKIMPQVATVPSTRMQADPI